MKHTYVHSRNTHNHVNRYWILCSRYVVGTLTHVRQTTCILQSWLQVIFDSLHYGIHVHNICLVTSLKLFCSYSFWRVENFHLGLEDIVLIPQYPISNIPYPTAFQYGNSMVLHFYKQQESSTTKTVHKVINKGLKRLCIVASHWWEFPLTLIPVSSTCFEKLFYPSSGALDCVLQLVV